MKTLKLIIPGNTESIIEYKNRAVMEGLGLDPEWFMTWVLYQWPLLGKQNDLEMYDMLYTQIEESTDAGDMEPDAHMQFTSYLEEHIDDLSTAAYGIFNHLKPLIGDLPVEHPFLNVMGVDYQPFGKTDSLLHFSYEERNTCDL